MKLCRLELDQVRKFDRAVRIETFADGLNLLCGPNEMGKSTLLAALQAVLFERHRAGGQQVRALAPYGSRGGPWVALDFELTGQRYRIEKRFLQREYARLTGPDGRPIEGEEAEEELQRLLGFDRAGTRGPTPEQLGAWSLLWVGQGAAFEQPEVVERARRSLEACLAGQVGALVGSDDARRLWRKFDEELHQLIDRRGAGRPRGRFKDVVDQLAELDAEREQLQAQSRRLEDDLARLQDTKRRLAVLEDRREDERLADEREKTRRELEERHRLQDRIRAGEAELQLLAKEADALAAEIARRREECQSIAGLEQAFAGRQAEAEAARAALAAAEGQLAGQQRKCDELERARDDAARLARAARRRAERDRLGLELERRRRQHEQARAAEREARELRREAERIRLDERALTELRQAERDLERAEAEVRAHAAVVRFDLAAHVRERVRIDGAPIPGATHECQAAAPLDIEIQDVGRITVSPGSAGRDERIAARETARARLQRLLAAAEVADVAGAEARLSERQRLAAQADRAADRLRLLVEAAVPGRRDLAALAEEVMRLEGQMGEAEEALRGFEAADASAAATPVELERQAESLEEELRATRAACDVVAKERARRQQDLARLEEMLRHGAQEIEQHRRTLAASESTQPGAELERAAHNAAARAGLARRSLESLRQRAEELPLDLLKSRLERIETALARRGEERAYLRETVSGLEAAIARDEGLGLAERLAELERRQGALMRERDALEQQVKILRLLKDTIHEAERAAKERYMEPVRARMRPYLRWLFPGAELGIDESFRITAVTRASIGPEPFASLSDGTREQIAVLARLAFGELLADQGAPAVVVLDDALAFADDVRLQRMFDVLVKAAERLQIVLLTCRERAFDGLGGHRLRIVQAREEAAAL